MMGIHLNALRQFWLRAQKMQYILLRALPPLLTYAASQCQI